MTKKNFEEVAKIIRNTDSYMLREYITDSFIREFSRVYKRFDKEKFRKACGVLSKS